MKLLADLEEAVFRLAVLALMIPKTLLRILMAPRRIVVHIEEQAALPPERRYDEMSSPITYWIVLSIGSLFGNILMNDYVGLVIVRSVGAAFGGSGDATISELDYSENRIWQTFAVCIWFPMIGAAMPLWWKRDRLTRSSLEPMFHVQCYAFGTVWAIVSIASVISVFTPWSGAMLDLSSLLIHPVAIALALLWYWPVHVSLMMRSGITGTVRQAFALLLMLGLSGVLCAGSIAIIREFPSGIFH